MKQNCWEFTGCGREEGGKKSHKLGVCPAVSEYRLNNIHDGKNAGRACWVVAGTFCGGVSQGTHLDKAKTCLGCDFYKKVRAEEFPNFKMLSSLLPLLKGYPKGEGISGKIVKA